MTDLSPGLAPDEVEKLRWHTFGQKRALALRSAADLVRFTTARGFVLVFPEPGAHFPSVLEAAAGRPLLELVRDERSAQVETWRDECTQAKQLALGTLYAASAALLAPEWIGVLERAATSPRHAAGWTQLRHDWPGTPFDGDALAARAAVAKRILTTVLVASAVEVAQSMAWTEGDALAALRSLVERGEARLHPASRLRRETFEAVRSDLLP